MPYDSFSVVPGTTACARPRTSSTTSRVGCGSEARYAATGSAGVIARAPQERG